MHLICVNMLESDKYIEVKKELRSNGVAGEHEHTIAVSIPLEHGRYMKQFPAEMMAYEFIENIVMEPIDALHTEYAYEDEGVFRDIKMSRITCPIGYDMKRRRIST